MLIYKDGRFYANNSSFALVNGCKVNDNPLAWYRNGINLYTEDESCMIDINFEYGHGGAQGSMEESMVTEELVKLSGTRIESRVFAGHTCWCAEYQGDLYKYFEARFDAPTGLIDKEGNNINIFRMVVTAPLDSDVKTILRYTEIIGILNSFRP
jgi:hypothetical protein